MNKRERTKEEQKLVDIIELAKDYSFAVPIEDLKEYERIIRETE